MEQNATVTAGLTDDQLGKLKVQVQELGSSAKEHVASFLADSKAWWHLHAPITTAIDDSSSKYWTDARGGPERIEKQLGLALGKLGSILEPFGYLAGTGRWPKDSAGRFYANPKWVEWPKELSPMMYRYARLVSEAQILIAELARLRLGRRPMAEGDSWRTYAAKARYWFAAYDEAVEQEKRSPRKLGKRLGGRNAGSDRGTMTSEDDFSRGRGVALRDGRIGIIEEIDDEGSCTIVLAGSLHRTKEHRDHLHPVDTVDLPAGLQGLQSVLQQEGLEGLDQ